MSEATALYPRLLGDEWSALPPAVRRAHFHDRPVHLAGAFDLEAPPGRWAGLARWALRLPRRSARVRATLKISAFSEGEIWSRRIGEWGLVTREQAAGDMLREIFGPLEFTFLLSCEGQALRYRQTRLHLRILGIALPVPPSIQLRIDALEKPSKNGDGTHVQVQISLSSCVLLTYHGDLEVRP